MANNRIVLVCTVCYPEPGEWKYHPPGCFVLAKYYPSTGYYSANGFTQDKIDRWFDDHRHFEALGYNDPITKQEATYTVDHRIRMEYEVKP